MQKPAGRRSIPLLFAILLVSGLAARVDAGSIRILGGDTLQTRPGRIEVYEFPDAPEAPEATEAPDAWEVPDVPDPPDRSFGRDGIEITIIDGDEIEARLEHRAPEWRRSRREKADYVRYGEDILVEADEIIDGSVVAIGGNVVIHGRVTGDAIAFGGDVELRRGAVIDGDAVAIGGSIERDPGARIDGADIGLNFISGPGFIHIGPGPLGGVGFQSISAVATFFFLFVLGWILTMMMGRRMRGMGQYIRAKLWPSFFAGVAIHIAFLPALILLLVTVVGIPLAILLPFVFAVATLIGYLVVVTLVGARLLGGDSGDGATWLKGLALGLAVFLGFPLFSEILSSAGGFVGFFGAGLTLFALAGNWTALTIGIGALLLSRVGGKVDQTSIPLPPGEQPGTMGGALPSPRPSVGG